MVCVWKSMVAGLLFALVSGSAADTAQAQEQCSVRWAFSAGAPGASLIAHEDCEDSMVLYSCRKGSGIVDLVLPGFEPALGAKETLTFKVGGKAESKVAVVMAPDGVLRAEMEKAGTWTKDARGYALSLGKADPVWRALLAGKEVAYEGKGWTSSFFSDKEGVTKLKALAAACGL